MTLLGHGDDVAERNGVGDQGQGADHDHHRGIGCDHAGIHGGTHDGSLTAGSRIELLDGSDTLRIEDGQGGPAEPLLTVLEGLLEEREHLGEHAPDRQGVGTVHDPAATVPAEGCDGRSQQQGDTAVPTVRRQAVVGISEVPDIVDHDIDPGHVRPDHILLILGGPDAPPGRHAEDVEQSGHAVHHVVPAAILPDAFGGQPPLVPAHHGALKVRDAGDEDVDGDNHEREGLEPMLGTDAPLVLDHHETDTPGRSGIQFGIVEPALHIDMRLVFQRPLRSGTDSQPDGEEIDGQRQRDDQERDDTASLGAAGKLIKKDQAQQDHDQHAPLSEGVLSINLEKHNKRFWLFKGFTLLFL